MLGLSITIGGEQRINILYIKAKSGVTYTVNTLKHQQKEWLAHATKTDANGLIKIVRHGKYL